MKNWSEPSYPLALWGWGPAEVRRYALAVGAPRSPLDEGDLGLVMTDEPEVLPTFAMLLADAHSLRYIPLPGVDYEPGDVIYAGHELELFGPLPSSLTGTSTSRILSVGDVRSGVLVRRETLSRDEAGKVIARNVVTSVIRGAVSGESHRPLTTSSEPVGPLDEQIDVPTLPQQALLYAQTGDNNPLHWNPAVARAAGFDRPILHGLCSAAMVTRAVIGHVTDHGWVAFRRLSVRFTSPVVPGDTIRVGIGGRPDALRFAASVGGREVLSAGLVEMNGAA